MKTNFVKFLLVLVLISFGLMQASAQDANADFNGDGKTDYTIIRDISGQYFWMTSINGTGVNSYIPWGNSASNDFFVPEDYDGDGKDDIAVWRPISTGQSTGNAFFYILKSSTNTFQSIDFGQSGDDPTVTGDYDGDNIADAATYRCPIGNGQCYFYYKGTLNNQSGNITFVPWGFKNNSLFFAAPGDYDGDGKFDFCLQRANPTPTTNGQFVLLRSSDFGVEYIDWGKSSDSILPGDYDGDGKFDFCVSRLLGAQYQFFILTRTGGGTGANPIIWGDASTDFTVPGDYDGDGKQDIAVWRSSVGVFYIRRSSDNALSVFNWGKTGDYPVAEWRNH